MAGGAGETWDPGMTGDLRMTGGAGETGDSEKTGAPPAKLSFPSEQACV